MSAMVVVVTGGAGDTGSGLVLRVTQTSEAVDLSPCGSGDEEEKEEMKTVQLHS